MGPGDNLAKLPLFFSIFALRVRSHTSVEILQSVSAISVLIYKSPHMNQNRARSRQTQGVTWSSGQVGRGQCRFATQAVCPGRSGWGLWADTE